MTIKNLDISLFELPQPTEAISGMHMPDDRAQGGPMGMPDERVFSRKSSANDFDFDALLPEYGKSEKSELGLPNLLLGEVKYRKPEFQELPEYSELIEAQEEVKRLTQEAQDARIRGFPPDKKRAAHKRVRDAYEKLNNVREKWLNALVKMEEERTQRIRTTNKARVKDLIPGGIGDYANISELKPDQIGLGLNVELEHTDNPAIALEIAKDHLTEDPEYYTKLKKIEKDSSRKLRFQLRKLALGLLSLPADSQSQQPVANRLGLDESEYEVANQFLGADSPVDAETHPKNSRNENYEYPQVKGEDPDFIHFLFGDIEKMRPALEELKASMKNSGREKESKKISDLIQKNAQMAPDAGKAAMDAYQSYRAAVQAFPKVMGLASMGDVKLNAAINSILGKYLPGSMGFNAEGFQKEIKDAFAGRYLSSEDVAAIQDLVTKAQVADQTAREARVQQISSVETEKPPMTRPAPRPQAHVLFRGQEVVEVQKLLGVTPADGLWGPRTQTAWLMKKPDNAPDVPESAAQALQYLMKTKVTEKPTSVKITGLPPEVPEPTPTQGPQTRTYQIIHQEQDKDGNTIGIVDYGKGNYGGAIMRDGKWVKQTLTPQQQRYLGLGRLQTGLFGPSGKQRREEGRAIRQERRRANLTSALNEIKKVG